MTNMLGLRGIAINLLNHNLKLNLYNRTNAKTFQEVASPVFAGPQDIEYAREVYELAKRYGLSDKDWREIWRIYKEI